MTEKLRVVVGSDSVFLDLGFHEAEAQNQLLRMDLVIQIRKAIAKLDLTQAAAAKRANITQSRMNEPEDFQGGVEAAGGGREGASSPIKRLHRPPQLDQ